MVRAYVLIETTVDKTGDVLAGIGSNLTNCLALGHNFMGSEVVAHLHCDNLRFLHEAIVDNLPSRDGVIRVTPLQIINED
jgi:hypothetical protein